MYVAAEGFGVGPNPTGPNPTLATDPIFWAFNMTVDPTTDVFGTEQPVTYLAGMVMGRAGGAPPLVSRGAAAPRNEEAPVAGGFLLAFRPCVSAAIHRSSGPGCPGSRLPMSWCRWRR